MRKSVHVLEVRWSQSAWLYPRLHLLRFSNVMYTAMLDATKPLQKVGNKLRIDTASYPGSFWSSWNLTPYRNSLDVQLSSYNFESYFSYSYTYTDVCHTCLCIWMSSIKELFSLISFCLDLCKSTAACWIPTTCCTSCYHKTFCVAIHLIICSCIESRFW
jgi:hypothetical protein